MKIVIISDIHDNLVYLETCLNWCRENKIETMICCGDVTTLETFKILRKNFSGEIHFVFGNIDMFKEREISGLNNVKCYGRIGIAEICGRKFGMCHEPFLIEKVLEKGKCDIIFYGHTHKPWIEDRNGVTWANPGTLGGVFQKSTFAVFDCETGNLELKATNEL